MNVKYKHIIFDFDGVLADTNPIRLEGFRLLMEGYPQLQVDEFVKFCRSNSGMSRFEKIKYFFKEIQNEEILKEDLNIWASRYSGIVKDKIVKAPPLQGSLEFLRSNFKIYDFAIVSGSEQQELRDVCRQRKISHFFIEILGSPITKAENVAMLLAKMRWERKKCVFIGDSITDFDAALANGIDFIGRDSSMANWSLIKNIRIFTDFSQLPLLLDVVEKGAAL